MTRRKDPQPDAVEAVLAEPAAEPEPVAAEPRLAAPASTDLPAPSNPPRRAGVLGPLLGGALAALGGFALSHFDLLGLAPAERSAEVAALAGRLDALQSTEAAAKDALQAEVAKLAERVAKLEATPAPVTPDLSKLDTLDQRLSAIEAIPAEGGASTAALTAKLAELERRIAALPAGGASPEMQAELDAALARLSAAEATATARAAEAEAVAAAAAREKALDRLTDAIVAGRPFAGELQAMADETLTAALGPMAEARVPTLATLQTDFPDAAREALRIARDISPEDGWSDRLVDFLAAQTGARSLTPRQGDGPDAVLSRAEFALSEGRVADAIAEMRPLDPAVRAPLEPWIAAAGTHLAADAALAAARGK